MQRPHILMIISHDTGRHLGCYGASVATPNLDRLAAEGVRFAQSFCVAAQCSPSRGSLMTGRYPHRNGLIGLAHLGWSLNPDEICLPEYLNRTGYETHLFGFQHEAPRDQADRLGYQQIHPAPHNYIDEVVPLVEEFLRARSPGSDSPPLFLMVGVEETHREFQQPIYTPDDPNTVAVPTYLPDAPGVREDLAWFHGTVKALDAGVGRILAALERAGMSADTLVIYTTDHGIAFPRAKGMSYDPGLETALLMRWPDRIPPGLVRRQMVTHLDFLPTLLELVGAPQPAHLDGRSYLPLLAEEGSPPREHFFVEMTWHDRYNPHRGIRTDRFKYIRNFDPDATLVYVPLDIHKGPAGTALPREYYDERRPEEELYDLSSDPLERHNLAGDPGYAEVVVDLRTRVQRWMEQTRDPLLKGPVPPTPEQARIDWRPKG